MDQIISTLNDFNYDNFQHFSNFLETVLAPGRKVYFNQRLSLKLNLSWCAIAILSEINSRKFGQTPTP